MYYKIKQLDIQYSFIHSYNIHGQRSPNGALGLLGCTQYCAAIRQIPIVLHSMFLEQFSRLLLCRHYLEQVMTSFTR
jgi:hypothetical protein